MKPRIVIAILMSAQAMLAADNLLPIPPTPRKPVVDDYQGTKVTDDYRWLENGADTEVRDWSRAQNARTRAYLDRLPMREELVARLKALHATRSPRFSDLQYRGGTLFAIETQPPKLQSFLVTLASPDDAASARPVVDPNALDPTGATSIDFYAPSLDAKLVAVSLSKNGSEDGSVSVFEVASGKRLPDLIPRVNFATAGGSVAWKADSTGFWFTRYPHTGERPPGDINFYQQIYFHKLGGGEEYALGRELPRIAEIALTTSDSGRFLLARVADGDGGDFLNYMRMPDGRWHQITRLADKISLARFGPDDSLYMLSRDDAPMGKILELSPPSYLLSAAKTVVTPGRSSIEDFRVAGSHLIVHYMAGGPSKLLDKEPGKSERTVEIGAVSSVGEIARVGDQILFESQSFVDPPAWFRY
ncbi:MAG TPA: hypothetical protein VKS01_00135, partial [Bryobacteraceae bacterium]|nr:hypothetical protein [Bryobacteraceae bacterium]